MANKWLDQLAGILESGRQVSGAKEASALLQQNFSYPSLSSLLPWRMYDGQSDLYINGRSVGFMLELSPLIGANQQVVQGLDALLREKLPRKTPLTVMMVASKCVGGMLQQALSTDMWKGPMAPRLNAITRAYWERAALKGFTNKRDYPLYLRNYRVFLVYAQSGRGGISGMDEVSRVRDSVTMALKGAYMDCRRIQPGEFLSVMREQLNYRPGQVTASDSYWNPDQELHRQAVHPSTELEVYPGYPVVKLSLKYREQKKYHPALIERDFRDNLSPELENIIRHNEREAAGLGLRFPAGEGGTEGATDSFRSAGTVAVTEAGSSTPVQTAPTPVRSESTAQDAKSITTQPVFGLQAPEPLPDNVRAFPGRETVVSAAGPDAARAVVRPQAAAAAEKVPPAPEAKPAVTPFTPNQPVRTTSALDILARRTSRPAATDDSAASEEGAQGEAPELGMVAEKDDAGQLIVQTAGYRKGGNDSREDAYADQYRQANYRMAEDEKNILRHREDYEAWQEMGDHHDHGDYER